MAGRGLWWRWRSLIAGCGGCGDKKNGLRADLQGRAGPDASQGQREEADPRSSIPKKTYTATVVTSCGTFVIELDAKTAPKTGGSFVTLAKKGFYDGLGFHRVEPGFVVQGGDPAGDGSGDPGYTITEKPPADTVYPDGAVAMAKTATEPPGTSGSQFFVTTSDSQLPPEYAVLGRVTKGMDVIHEMETHGAAADPTTGVSPPPDTPIVIDSITITES